MNATATKTETIPCPKCFGGRSFAVWSHYAGGMCFRCNGAGVVDASAQTLAQSSIKAPACREVILADLGRAYISRNDAGFRADIGLAAAWFSVKGGRIADLVVSDGLHGKRAEVQTALQAALRV
jgi:hypothetical protein